MNFLSERSQLMKFLWEEIIVGDVSLWIFHSFYAKTISIWLFHRYDFFWTKRSSLWLFASKEISIVDFIHRNIIAGDFDNQQWSINTKISLFMTSLLLLMENNIVDDFSVRCDHHWWLFSTKRLWFMNSPYKDIIANNLWLRISARRSTLKTYQCDTVIFDYIFIRKMCVD